MPCTRLAERRQPVGMYAFGSCIEPYSNTNSSTIRYSVDHMFPSPSTDIVDNYRFNDWWYIASTSYTVPRSNNNIQRRYVQWSIGCYWGSLHCHCQLTTQSIRYEFTISNSNKLLISLILTEIRSNNYIALAVACIHGRRTFRFARYSHWTNVPRCTHTVHTS